MSGGMVYVVNCVGEDDGLYVFSEEAEAVQFEALMKEHGHEVVRTDEPVLTLGALAELARTIEAEQATS